MKVVRTINEIFKLFGTIGLNNDEANRGIDETTGKAEGAGSKIAGYFKKAAVVIGTAFAAEKLINFGRMAVEASASAAALSAQFEQVFGDLQGESTKAINEMAKEFGMVPSRLKPGMTKMTSMFKGLGLETEEAMGMATDAVKLSADAAAFYDVSFENANQSLSSFLKGNYEAGESIGIFANDTQLATFAIEQGVVSAAKEWTALDEATKQATRLEYAKNMQELAGATGQASRESDGYENQMGNLRQAWQDFLAIAGGPLLAPVVNGLKMISGGLVIAGKKVQELQAWFGQLMERFKQTEAWQSIQTAVQLVIDKFNDFVSKFETIKQNIADSAVWDVLKGYLQALVDFWTGLFSGEGDLGATFMRIFGMIRDIAVPILNDAIEFAKSIIGQLTTFWNDNGQQIMLAVQNAWQFIANVIQFLMPVIEMIITTVWGNIKGVIQGALNIIMGAIKIFAGLFTGDWSKLWEGVKQLLGGALEFIYNLWNLMMIGKLFGSIKSFIAKAFSSLKGFATNIINAFKTGSTSISNVFTSARTLLTNIANGIKSGISNTFNGLWNTVKTIWNGIKTAITNPIQSAKNTISNIIDAIKRLFNFKISWPKIPMPSFGISPSGWKIGDLLKGSIPKLSVAWNAKGGIFNEPTIFDTAKGLQGVGEAGPEAIIPLNRETLGGIGEGIFASMGNNEGEIQSLLGTVIYELRRLAEIPIIVELDVDGKRITRELANPMRDELAKIDANRAIITKGRRA